MAFSSWRTWVTGETVTATHMNQEVRDNGNALFPDGATVDTWSPTLEASGTNPTTTSADGTQYRIGALQFFWVRFVISTPGSGSYFVALPRASVGVTGSGSAGSGSQVGGWHARDDSTGGVTAAGSLQVDGLDDVRFVIADSDASHKVIDADQPWAWASGDVLTLSGFYPIA